MVSPELIRRYKYFSSISNEQLNQAWHPLLKK